MKKYKIHIYTLLWISGKIRIDTENHENESKTGYKYEQIWFMGMIYTNTNLSHLLYQHKVDASVHNMIILA